MLKFVNIGFGNLINAGKVVTVVSPDAAPVKRLIQSAREEGRVIDATQGRKTKGVLVTEDAYVILSALQPDTLGRRLQSEQNIPDEKGEEHE